MKALFFIAIQNLKKKKGDGLVLAFLILLSSLLLYTSLSVFMGNFQSDFSLDTNKLANYRVKYISKNETLYLKIIEYDANNYLRERQHHIVLVMEEDRKYFDR